jgi:aspartyl-tRNA(Asn)/glutamyl-tRNA(Gln) amidotransferase subunit A
MTTMADQSQAPAVFASATSGGAHLASKTYFAEAKEPPPTVPRSDKESSPLRGLRIAIKSNIAVKGFRTVAGCAALAAEAPALEDAPVVARLRESGLAIIATTVMDELAYGFTGRNAHFGYVPNPHDVDRISGGSSSGAAAAIAAGMLDLAVGTDTNGSVRIPAALCGVWGLRPTTGSVSAEGTVPLSTTLDIPGPLANSAAYLTALASALGISISAASPKDIRIARVSGFPATPVTPAVAQAIDSFASSIGVTDQVATPWAAAARAGAQIMTAFEAAVAHRQILTDRSDLIGRLTRNRLIAGACLPPDAYKRAVDLRAALRQRIESLFEGHDILMLPTVASEAPLANAEMLETDGIIEPVNAALGRCTIAFSFLGLPALSVPIRAKTAKGLPVGAQFVGRPGTDDVLLALGEGLEAAGLAAAHVVSKQA